MYTYDKYTIQLALGNVLFIEKKTLGVFTDPNAQACMESLTHTTVAT